MAVYAPYNKNVWRIRHNFASQICFTPRPSRLTYVNLLSEDLQANVASEILINNP